MLKHDRYKQDMDVKLDRERERNENLKKKIAEMDATMKLNQKQAKDELKKIQIERDESNKLIVKLQGKER